MQIEGTKEAFTELIKQKGFAAKYGLNKTTVSQWNSGDRVPSLDKMEEILIKAGAKVVQEKVWEVPEPNSEGRITGPKSSLLPRDVAPGNLVQIQYQGGKIVVADKRLIAIICAGGGSSYSGIPLTEEWLVKLGFSHDGHGFFKHPTENFCLYNNVEGCYFECYKEVPANDETGHFKILKYVHRLQNLFYELFDEELTIKNIGV